MEKENKSITQDPEQHSRCERLLFSALEKNHTIRKLISEIEDLGCTIPPNFFLCKPSTDPNVSGGFVMPDPQNNNINEYKPGVVIFENRIIEKESFENTIAHELVHAYDQCRAKIKLNNCLHHACTEIRASNLSGECTWWQELNRGNLTVVEGKMKCVKRRAQLSLSSNPYCKDRAEQSVETVFPVCYNDISPLNEDDLWKS
mmetsp:Transcript_23386/g.24034  ORF Transcript_23386/g.24034 Transcript_23386/m.24034 type:complete len:202 (+) Transcript_23386:67-672(+)